LRPSALIDVNFLARAMETSAALDQATACATGIAQKTVPLSGLRRLVLPLPPFAEQRRIVAKVDELMGLCDRLEASLTAAAATRRRLLDALLAEALAPADTREMEAAE
jgi:type I restriction enzyme S subunit